MARKLRVEGFSIYEGDVAVGSAVTIADRELFAASPLMLAALQRTLTWMRADLGLDDDSPEVAPVLAAIKAAKGE